MQRLERGSAGLWVILFLLLLIVLVGVKFSMEFFDHEKFEENVREIGRRAIEMPRVKYEDEILELLDRSYLDYDEEDIELDMDREKKVFSIYIPYTRYVNLFVTKYPLRFVSDLEVQVKQGSFMQGIQEDVEGSYEQGEHRAREALKDFQQ